MLGSRPQCATGSEALWWETLQLSQPLARPAGASQGKMPALAAETARPVHL